MRRFALLVFVTLMLSQSALAVDMRPSIYRCSALVPVVGRPLYEILMDIVQQTSDKKAFLCADVLNIIIGFAEGNSWRNMLYVFYPWVHDFGINSDIEDTAYARPQQFAREIVASFKAIEVMREPYFAQRRQMIFHVISALIFSLGTVGAFYFDSDVMWGVYTSIAIASLWPAIKSVWDVLNYTFQKPIKSSDIKVKWLYWLLSKKSSVKFE